MTLNGGEPQLPLAEGCISRRINMDPTMVVVGGGRALLLQVAHPSVAAGVAEFSDYRSDPWNRLLRTTETMYQLAFGTPEQSARQASALARMHARVEGVNDLGEQYRATEPHLLLWVWATLTDTSRETYERVFGPLTEADAARFYLEQVPMALACGVPSSVIPADHRGFATYFAGVIKNDLHITDTARDVLSATLTPPTIPPFRQLMGSLSGAATTALLPPSVRDRYGLAWNADVERRAERMFTLARGTHRLPQGVRHLPAQLQIRSSRPIRVPKIAGRAPGARTLERHAPPSRSES